MKHYNRLPFNPNITEKKRETPTLSTLQGLASSLGANAQ